MEEIDLEYRDTFGRTIKKAPWKRIGTDTALGLVSLGTSIAVSPMSNLVGAVAVELVAEQLFEYMVCRFTDVYESGEFKLKEFFGRTLPDAKFSSVAEFWAKVDNQTLPENALIEIIGLLSPYGPLMPANPMSRPGYYIEGWNAIGDLGVSSTEEYDAQDGFIYGDRVMRLSQPRNKKYYAGLYDAYYGIANVSLPLYVDEKVVNSSKYGLIDLWTFHNHPGKIVTLKGRLKRLTSYYAQFAGQLPEQYCKLPSYGLEVFSIESSREPDGVTHISTSVSWARANDERLITTYFDVQNPQQFELAEQELDVHREKHKKWLLFNYDDLACLSSRWRYMLPQYNEMLKPWLEGQSSSGL